MTHDDSPPPDPRPADAPPARGAGVRWLAPLLSVLVLAILMGRVTTCGERAERAVAVEPAAVEPAAVEQPVVPLRGTKSFGIESPGEKAQHAPGLGPDTELLGGSKSGFGGLGLKGSGRLQPAAPAPTQTPSPPSPSPPQALP